MDSPAAQLELVRPWRTATLIAGSVAALELVLLVVLGMVLLGRTVAPHVNAAAARAARTPKQHAAPPAAEPVHRPGRAAKLLPRSKTAVLILNGNGISGAAAATATVVRSRGYRVSDTRNAPRSGYPTWRLMAAPGFASEAKRFARDMGLSQRRVGPLDGMLPHQLHGAKLVLILGVAR